MRVSNQNKANLENKNRNFNLRRCFMYNYYNYAISQVIQICVYANAYFLALSQRFVELVLVIAPLGGMLLVYSPNCYEVTTVYINSLLSDQGRAVYKPIAFSYRVHYN